MTTFTVWASLPGLGPCGMRVGGYQDREEACAVALDAQEDTGGYHWITTDEPDGVTLLIDPGIDRVVDVTPTWAMVQP